MKSVYKLVLAVCLLVNLAVVSTAQVNIGFQGGVHLAYNNLTFDHDFSEIRYRDDIAGLTVAIPIEWPASKMFRFQSGLNFLTRGTRIHNRDPQNEVNYINKYAISYLQIPILAKVSMKFNPFNLFVIGGADVAYAVDFELLKMAYDGGGLRVLENRKLDFERARISRFDIGLAFGGGIEATISRGRRIFVDVRFHIGLNDIDKRPEVDVYNNGHSYTLGMMLPIRMKKNNRKEADLSINNQQ